MIMMKLKTQLKKEKDIEDNSETDINEGKEPKSDQKAINVEEEEEIEEDDEEDDLTDEKEEIEKLEPLPDKNTPKKEVGKRELGVPITDTDQEDVDN